MNVILYGVPGCHKCAFLSKLLEQRGIQYQHVTDVDAIIDLGLDSVPAMSVDGNILYETEAMKWLVEHKGDSVK